MSIAFHEDMERHLPVQDSALTGLSLWPFAHGRKRGPWGRVQVLLEKRMGADQGPLPRASPDTSGQICPSHTYTTRIIDLM